MSQAEELLNSLTDEQMATYLANSESEPHIIIGNDRYIKVPESLKRIAVENDHNIETVVFDCPRYWDDHDLSRMVIYINYKLSNGFTGSYIADNITVDGDILHFSWTITRTITSVKGNIIFLVCAKKTDADGNEENHWNSELNTEMYVSEGLETDLIVEEEYPDVVTQLLERMYVVEGINVQASEMQSLVTDAKAAAKGAQNFASDAKNTLDMINLKDADIRNSYANAIKGNVGGEIIRVDDVSPIEHDVKCWVHGKNLIPNFTGAGSNPVHEGVTFSWVSGGHTITLNGTSTGGGGRTLAKSFCTPITLRKGVSYSLQCSLVSGSASKCLVFLNDYHKDTVVMQTSLFGAYGTVIPTKDIQCYVGVNAVDGTTYENTTVDFQLEEGPVATSYEPWVDPSTVTVKKCGKVVFSKASQTVSGVNEPWTSLLVAAVRVPPGDYVASCRFNQVGQDISIVSLSPRSYNDYAVPLVRYSSLNSTENKSGYLQAMFTVGKEHGGFQIFLYSNTPNEPLTTECLFEDIYVEVGSVATGYEQYIGEDYTPESDGTCIVKSVSPTMTLFTNTAGVTVEAEYNRDTTKMFESYVLTDEAKNEIATKVEDDMAEVLASLNSYATSLIGGDS